MTDIEQVRITAPGGLDANNNPIPAGVPVILTPLAIAPGNTTQAFGQGGDLDEAEYTVYLPLTDEGKILDGYGIHVRGRDCIARVKVWKWPAVTTMGGIEVLCQSATGNGG